jgi:hypothetical protein
VAEWECFAHNGETLAVIEAIAARKVGPRTHRAPIMLELLNMVSLTSPVMVHPLKSHKEKSPAVTVRWTPLGITGMHGCPSLDSMNFANERLGAGSPLRLSLSS